MLRVPAWLSGRHAGLRAGLLLALLLVLASVGRPAQAQEAPLVAEDPAVEARMMGIARELRCLVCQNETIAESHADLAVDLREQIREQLKAGQSPQQIRNYMVARYGEFVLYRPPFSMKTLLLWLGPFVLLLLGFGVLWRIVRRRPESQDAEPALDPRARQRARELLGVSEDHPPS
ncbi:MAG: cytochrome c-type biogenesis protein [Ottowia sp.]|nr:cytochrome c-type biogenesis protein CcmH [Ottowia sp.]